MAKAKWTKQMREEVSRRMKLEHAARKEAALKAKQAPQNRSNGSNGSGNERGALIQVDSSGAVLVVNGSGNAVSHMESDGSLRVTAGGVSVLVSKE